MHTHKLGAVYMVSGTRDTLPPEPFCARQNYIDIIAAETRFKLVSAGRVTLAVRSLCLRRRITLGKATKLVHVNSLPRPPRTTFQTQACAIGQKRSISMCYVFVIL